MHEGDESQTVGRVVAVGLLRGDRQRCVLFTPFALVGRDDLGSNVAGSR